MELPRSGGFLLRRSVPGSDRSDAMGPYPLFSCTDWRGLAEDLRAIGPGLLSVSLVADPFGDHGPDQASLRAAFPDLLRPFKEHHLADPLAPRISEHHRRYARFAERRLVLERCEDPSSHLDDWARLYGELIERHGLRGIKAFSRDAFAAQLALPGVEVFRARAGSEVVGMQLWLVAAEVAYSHLVASSARGYALRAAYGLHALALDWFRGRVRWLDIGAGAGAGSGGCGGGAGGSGTGPDPTAPSRPASRGSRSRPASQVHQARR
ncbi:MAG TPA: hypothetical protein VF341_07195, partial [Anaeromyxobacteraceae bacterium]